MSSPESQAGVAGAPSARLSLTGARASQHLLSLRTWLSHEEALRGRVRDQRPSPRPGEMGGAIEALVVALGSGGAGAILARSVTTWLTQTRADISLTISKPDGSKVTVTVARAKDAQAVISEIRELLEPASPNGTDVDPDQGA